MNFRIREVNGVLWVQCTTCNRCAARDLGVQAPDVIAADGVYICTRWAQRVPLDRGMLDMLRNPGHYCRLHAP